MALNQAGGAVDDSGMAVVLMMLTLGLAVLLACVLMPREIGKEDLPLSSVRVKLPDVEGLALRMRAPRRPTPRPAPALVTPPPEDGPSAMGAPQPVLSQPPTDVMALPGQ